MANTTTLERLRPCGRLETYSTARHHLGFYKNVGLTATYSSLGVSSSAIERLVFAALRCVVQEHPSLSVIALNEDKSYPNVYFARLPEVDLGKCVSFQERETAFPKDGEVDKELDALLTKQHSRDFKHGLGTRPFWRLIIATSRTPPVEFTATWIWHHALADGSSAVLFHNSFLAALNSSAIKTDMNAELLVKSPTTPLPPSFEDLHPMQTSWPFFLRAILGSIAPSIFNKRPLKRWTGNPIHSDTTSLPECRFRTIVFSTQTTEKLALFSRRERTSVTATLQCLIASSLFATLPASECEKVRIECPVSMRSVLDTPDNQMTNAVADFDYLHQLTQPNVGAVLRGEGQKGTLRYFSWDEARTLKSAITRFVAKEGCDNPVALLKYVPDMHAFFTSKLGKPRSPTAEISNLGVYKKTGDVEATWKIGRTTFSQCPNVTNCVFGVNVVTGGDGNAVLNFCWMQGATEGNTMDMVIESLRAGVEELVQNYGL
ncbi:hypothetical protein P153DRAFT_323362 [Dothidotthia symphoricarpi CBS 119687]|uniref:Alcohol acetyltransferase n=1 Tax=Dothidotthia symphoricarpi CBS 119687 TaxID=1392245 RepID=A0A6A6A2G9_9PLEO|nr:uncharacterized protein P153DRAFT_323362 [Dothidotthia symphoricarpi CBS 119687]KAF2126192.1 hypothetical protein P153DRAFT_323362 [Dothidotthia symphoricarpi CBS 119687]